MAETKRVKIGGGAPPNASESSKAARPRKNELFEERAVPCPSAMSMLSAVGDYSWLQIWAEKTAHFDEDTLVRVCLKITHNNGDIGSEVVIHHQIQGTKGLLCHVVPAMNQNKAFFEIKFARRFFNSGPGQ